MNDLSHQSNPECKMLWLSWQGHRRTVEISENLSMPLEVLEHNGPRWIRYPMLATKSLFVLAKRRPEILVVQNPSMALTLLAAVSRKIFGYKLVVDRHTNFYLRRYHSADWRWRFVIACSEWTLRAADLTIVTNTFLKNFVEQKGGSAIVVPDPIPEGFLEFPESACGVDACPEVFFVSTYATDEPLDEVLAAARELDGECRIIVSGSPKGRWATEQGKSSLPANVVQTGFIQTSEYRALMRRSSAVMVLTTLEHCLTCGAYEATAAEKPMILSNTHAIRQHFDLGAVYVDPNAASLAAGIREVLQKADPLRAEASLLREKLTNDWQQVLLELEEKLDQLIKPE